MLFGYSRGAYTVRSLAGMLHEAGLVTRSKLDHVHEAYELYRGDGDADRPAARKFRERHARRVPIKLLACFDTVGALGLPDGIAPRALQRKYEFHDTRLSRAVEHAVHIVSIDEDRKAFAPTLMRGREGQVRELYLPGGHGGVGGGDAAQRELARNALFVMVEECRKVCDIGMVESRLPKELVKSVPHREGSSPRREMIKFFTGQRHRNIPNVEALHSCVYERYQNVKEWRPPSLEQFASVLLKAKKK